MASTGLPHNFAPGMNGVNTGTYYALIPKSGPINSHVFPTDLPIYLPVTDQVGWSFSHEWTEADNLTKNLLPSLGQKVGGTVGAGSIGEFAGKVAQRKLGGGVHFSACSIYMDSAPPTISVKTKLFSQNGDGSILAFLDAIRKDTTANLEEGGASDIANRLGSLGGGSVGSGIVQGAGDFAQQAQNAVNKIGGKAAAKMGIASHPEWWQVNVVSFAGGGETVIASMADMVCTGINVTMYAPFVRGQGGVSEPMMVDLEINFKHGFRGLRSSMAFGYRVPG